MHKDITILMKAYMCNVYKVKCYNRSPMLIKIIMARINKKNQNTVFVAIPSSWVNTISDTQHSTHMGRGKKLITKSSMKEMKPNEP